MKSIWYEMGMRDGIFCGTVPAAFMNAAYRFFLDLRDQCRLSVSPGYVSPEYEKKFCFNARDKFGHWRGYTTELYRKMFSYTSWTVPMGTPCPETLWNASKPQWSKISFTESEILNEEEIATHPLSIGRGVGNISTSTVWEQQRYRLILKMRYVFVPLTVTHKVIDSSGGEAWYDFYENTGCVDRPEFDWRDYRQLRVQFPDYWTQESTVYKIGICAESLNTFTNAPLEGAGWVHKKSFTTAMAPDGGFWQGSSKLSIYGVVDLATHPDFSKYYEVELSNQTEEI